MTVGLVPSLGHSMAEQIKKISMREHMLAQVELRLGVLADWQRARLVPWAVDVDGTKLRDAKGELVPVVTPRNLDDFCKWQWEGNGPVPDSRILSFSKISRTNFYQPYNEHLRTRVDTAIKNIKACVELQLELHNKTSIIEAQRATIEYLEKVVENQEKETREARIATAAALKDERAQTAKFRSTITELRRALNDEQERSKELTASIAKITSLQRAK